MASLGCGSAAFAQSQTNSPPTAAPPPTGSVTNAVNQTGSSTNITQLENMTVVGRLDVARNQIVPDLGATVYDISKTQIAAQPLGENAPFNQVLLRAPGMAQDSAVNGDLHLRGEHGNIQYRINDVLLPEGITGFGQELDTRFVESMRLITGSLPAQYGFRTAGIVDLHTKSGAFEPGGEVSLRGGSFDTVQPSLEYGGRAGKWNFFADGSYFHSSLGIENHISSSSALHDVTDQYKTFAYASYLIDDTSRLSLMGSASYSDFQVPNTPGLPAGTAPNGNPWLPGNFDSANLNENQNEQNYYGVAAYQKSAGDLNFQVAAFGRVSTVHFTPDPVGDLFFNGTASDVGRYLYSGGVQADASYALGDKHTIRAGLMVVDESVSVDTITTVFPVDANGNPTGPAFPIVDNSVPHAIFAGVYLQDEWKLLPKLTLNYGARYDEYYASFDKENQPSPRVNLIYQATDTTTLHAGYARYFTPPPLETINSTTIGKFSGTSNASAVTQDNSPKAERANYFDAGITQKLAPGLQIGLDGYYKNAVNQLDDGLFGQTLILSSFNYAEGRVYGSELTGTYTKGGFSAYANLAYSVAEGMNWTSAQFLFDPDALAYVKNHWIHLDHDQTWTGSFGVSYLLRETAKTSTRLYADSLFGSGLRTDASGPGGVVVPNGGTVPSYYTLNLGAEQDFRVSPKQHLRARLDLVNITDNSYELRNGSGVGVNAAQWGMRFGVFGTLSYLF
jgi:outer membrane receptor protein involved in Fe transport